MDYLGCKIRSYIYNEYFCFIEDLANGILFIVLISDISDSPGQLS